MTQRRWLSLVLIALFAGAWSVSLGVLGLWFMMGQHAGLLSNRWVSGSAGLVSIGAAQLVFLACVADRFFPSTHERVRRAMQTLNLATLALGSGVLITASLIASV
ncbi:MAG: hypothetical protein KDA29_00210 [Phycisphaerales bacterium]|nr:hypothetical protein [Phycisphaerales bacterium]